MGRDARFLPILLICSALAAVAGCSSSSYSGGGGSGPTVPSIMTQPSSTAVSLGQTATFIVSASGTSPLSYQWRKNMANIGGATNASYTTPATVNGDNGAQFEVVVSNSAGSITSSAATLTVNPVVAGSGTGCSARRRRHRDRKSHAERRQHRHGDGDSIP